MFLANKFNFLLRGYDKMWYSTLDNLSFNYYIIESLIMLGLLLCQSLNRLTWWMNWMILTQTTQITQHNSTLTWAWFPGSKMVVQKVLGLGSK